MFSGIVEEMGEVIAGLAGGRTRLIVRCPGLAPDCRLGDSVGVNGCCLTVVAQSETDIEFDVMPETARRTNLAGLRPGERVNLEAALRYGDPVGGHMVSGHIDAVGEVISSDKDGNAIQVGVRVPAELEALIAAQGCIALDGISLTVTGIAGSVFTVGLIPHTLKVTNAAKWREGSKVNIEVDMMARYLARRMDAATAGAPA
jgi:riboflavin synthase alpha subunit